MNRPDAVTFAEFSYILAVVSAGIVLLSMIFNYIPSDLTQSLSQIMWLTVITSAVGAFLGYASQSDIKDNPDFPEATAKRAKLGFRANAILFGFMIMATLCRITLSIALN